MLDQVFVNVVYADEIQAFSEKKKLDDEGKEQEVRPVLSRFEQMQRQYKIKLDDRYKLPRLTYRGELPPPKHYIRKTQAPIIQEVTGRGSAASTKTLSLRKLESQAAKAPNTPKTATAHYKLFEEHGNERTICSRLPSIIKESTPLAPEILAEAGSRLIVSILFENKVQEASDLDLELQTEIELLDWLDAEIFLPYPVDVSSARVCLDRTRNSLDITMTIDKSWDTSGPDCGSAPWLLARALDEENETEAAASGGAPTATNDSVQNEPKSLVEMFHLINAAESNDSSSVQSTTPRWDPVLDDEELPEDRFHRKDMMSMHILEQRRIEREQKAKEAEDKRKKRRAEVEEMQKKANEAGKTWREMYPNEPETTYIDMENIVREEKERLDRQQQKQNEEEDPASTECMPTEEAKRAAAKWAENSSHSNLDLQSALAFDLL
ncbi:unnamed protein product [Phytophthora lilii]|uniref:Unnamed protein product n=1 Tax=Phytophthora lilii TaxID=2077276 RepID=A0A9W6TUG1_9STRA|nr:unnamed protein product [Phytophthora lilii]